MADAASTPPGPGAPLEQLLRVPQLDHDCAERS
jgi:hypothetical protein